MAERTPAARRRLRASLVVAVAATIVAGALPRLGAAGPETLVRTMPVPLDELLRGMAAPGFQLAGGELLAPSEGRTGRTVVCAPIEATGLGLTWRQAAPGEVEVRVAAPRADGTWTRPAHLDAEDDADPGSPDARAGTRGSSFLWTGGSRCVRVSLELDAGVRISELAVVFVDSSGTPGAPAVASANAAARQPRIVPREAWGADPALMNCTPIVADEVRMGFVHHTAGTNAYAPSEADDVVRGVYAYHTNGRGWCDIGYNFLVDRYGTIYEGRSGGIEEPVIGAAQMGFNTRAFSVSVMGNFETAKVSKATRRALVRLLTWRLDVDHVNPRARALMTSAGGSNTRYAKGTEVRLDAISGHLDTGYTACPGRNLYRLLPKIREGVAARGLPKMWNPRLNVDEIVVGDPATVRIRARGSTELDWSVVLLAPDGSHLAELGSPFGDRLDLVWPKTGPPAQPTEPGTYTVLLSAGAGGAAVRPAALPLRVVAPQPSPSPSASPTPSATPSPSASASP